MQTTHFRNQLHLRGRQIALIFALFVGFHQASYSQGMFGMLSGSGSDDQFLSYGFFLAGHTSIQQIKYSDNFVNGLNPAAPNVARISPDYKPGFSLGFIGMMKFHDQVHLMLTPKIGFYEFATDVTYFEGTVSPDNTGDMVETFNTVRYTSEQTLVEFPLLLRYRSQRFNNTRMYFLGGGSYRFRTKSQDEANLDDIVVDGQDFTLELGMGFEIYFKYFKFAPEIRFSHGLVDIYRPENSNPLFADAISSVKPKTITIYLNFQ
ncbi:type IX secretion/gliding motility protein PorT/SprT [Algoriphagus namhaensis]